MAGRSPYEKGGFLGKGHLTNKKGEKGAITEMGLPGMKKLKPLWRGLGQKTSVRVSGKPGSRDGNSVKKTGRARPMLFGEFKMGGN